MRDQTPFYAKNCLKVVDERGDLVPFVFRGPQLKLDAALEAQNAAGRPMRAIVLKSRKVGISTAVQGKLIHRATLRQNRRALVVAQNNDTAGELFDIGDTMYSLLPEDHDFPELRPGLVSRSSSMGLKMLHFGERATASRTGGSTGVNSTLKIDTAKEVNAGRGKTISELHASEVAFWPDPRKALGLLNAVPDQPGTLIVIESTANGHNFFKERWDRAERGEGGYAAVFISWTEDENCQRPFDDADHRDRFIESIGRGAWGEDEPYLIRRFGVTPEQLHWRRVAIVDKADGSLEEFKQEYPSTPEEAFIASGRHVFAVEFIRRVKDRVQELPAPEFGVLNASAIKRRRGFGGEFDVATGAVWKTQDESGLGPRHDFWRLWSPPVGSGQYIVAADVAAADEMTSGGEPAFHAIQVVNHETLEQVAEYRSRVDADEFAWQLLLAALYFNSAWTFVEITGGWGMPVARDMWFKYGYARLHKRKPVESSKDKTVDLIGWSTDRRTKPVLEAGMAELLREDHDGIRSVRLALELGTYVRADNGRSGPDDGQFSDLLMAYMIAQHGASTIPYRRGLPPELKSRGHVVRSRKGGY